LQQDRDDRPFAWRAKTDFFLSRDSVEIKTFTVNSGSSQLSFNGDVKNFHAPNVQGQYSATLDLVELSSIARNRSLRRGIVDLKGAGQWSLQDFATAGKLTARELEWRDESANLQNVTASTTYSVKPQRITLTGWKADSGAQSRRRRRDWLATNTSKYAAATPSFSAPD
jgi:hypothetical protein